MPGPGRRSGWGGPRAAGGARGRRGARERARSPRGRDAYAMDPQERLFLQAAWQVFEDAGYSREEIA
ncbi:beta-ketoacyl synthase N-terminal-like domain-containing protein, partial [Streptomyces sp. NPDC039022]|uniref:beta-ketoacyl synthase N-terminal-like domain-containing protein n=1 Tax=Streptomyces sp. NPDC039022 TaxID=3157091 RepID=UPI0033DD1B7B